MFDPTLAAISIGLHLQSIHIPSKPWMNNSNVGIYAIVDDVGFGVYKNTRSRTSAWIGYQIIPDIRILSTKPELYIGAISGYDSSSIRYKDDEGHNRIANVKHQSLYIAPSIKFNPDGNFSSRLTVLPGVVHAQIEWKFQ